MRLSRLLCRVGFHSWVVVRKPGVEPYSGCKHCSKEQMWRWTATHLAGGGGG